MRFRKLFLLCKKAPCSKEVVVWSTIFVINNSQSNDRQTKIEQIELGRMALKLDTSQTVKLTDWQIFTNNGKFNNRLPPSRRLRKQNPYLLFEIDSSYILDRRRSARSRSKISLKWTTRKDFSFSIQIDQLWVQVHNEY